MNSVQAFRLDSRLRGNDNNLGLFKQSLSHRQPLQNKKLLPPIYRPFTSALFTPLSGGNSNICQFKSYSQLSNNK
jgi:hypothetical protein